MLGKLLGLCSAFMLSLAVSSPSNCILMNQQTDKANASDPFASRVIKNKVSTTIQDDGYAPYVVVNIPQDDNNYRVSHNEYAIQTVGDYVYYRVQNTTVDDVSAFDILMDQEAFILVLPQQYNYNRNGNTATSRTFVPYYFTYTSWEQIDNVIEYYFEDTSNIFGTVAVYLSSPYIFIRLCERDEYPGDSYPLYNFGYSSLRSYNYTLGNDAVERIIGALENFTPLGTTPSLPATDADAVINALKTESGPIFEAFKDYTYYEKYAVDGSLERFYDNVMASDWVADSEWAQTYILSIRESGLERGESAGYTNGFDAGYQEAIDNEELAEPVGNFFSRLFGSLGSILNTRILGPLTLGSFLAIPLVIGVIVFIIKIAG